MDRIRIVVSEPASSSYDVLIHPGLLGELGRLVAEAAAAPRHAIIADETVAALHGDAALGALRGAGLRADLFRFTGGEDSKTRETWAQLTDALVDAGVGRDGCVVALGGGVTGDLAGFVAAAYMRGIALVQVPTTLLAMVDASVGGKTGVDAPGGKNLVGAFHQPRLVVVDPALLATLPEAELRAGLAEVVKHGAIADAAYLEWVAAQALSLHLRPPDVFARVVRRSVEIKAEVVSRDPLESGPRQALNFGHTIGHGIEAASGYAVPHGVAVAIGMVAEAAIGEAAGITAPGTAGALSSALVALGLPTALPPGVAADAVLERAHADKKARAGRVRYTLLARPGSVARGPEGEWTFAVDEAVAQAALSGLAQRASGYL